MNYLIDVDQCLVTGTDSMDRKFYFWLCDWSEGKNYYLISNRNFDELYACIGKDLIYRASAVYANGGRTVYIQSRLVEHHDIISSEPSKLADILPPPLRYFGTDLSIGKAVAAHEGNIAYFVDSWPTFQRLVTLPVTEHEN